MENYYSNCHTLGSDYMHFHADCILHEWKSPDELNFELFLAARRGLEVDEWGCDFCGKNSERETE